MRKTLPLLAALAATALGTAPARAQADDPSRACGTTARFACVTAAQALVSAYPRVGIVAAGGNPVLGTESTRGLSLGLIPHTTATLRLSAARITLPNSGPHTQRPPGHPIVDPLVFADQSSQTQVAVGVDVQSQLFPGFASGTVMGIGSVDLLLSGRVLPPAGNFRSPAASFGAGARIGIVRETFGTPGLSVSAMYRWTAPRQYGEVCTPTPATCVGDAGEVDFGVRDVSTRVVLGKRVGPLGLAGGLGFDRFSTSNAKMIYVVSDSANATVSGLHLSDTRWSIFGNAAYALPIGSVILEGGWMHGGDAVSGFRDTNEDFDPRAATVFASLGLRVSL